MSAAERTFWVDADVFITLAEIGSVDLLRALPGAVWIPLPVDQEIVNRPAATVLENAVTDESRWLQVAAPPPTPYVARAAMHLGRDVQQVTYNGDIMLLAHAMTVPESVVVTDDTVLRRCCRALGIPVSGTLGVLVHSVEQGTLEPATAHAKLFAVNKVGPRLPRTVLRATKRLISAAATGSAVDTTAPGTWPEERTEGDR